MTRPIVLTGDDLLRAARQAGYAYATEQVRLDLRTATLDLSKWVILMVGQTTAPGDCYVFDGQINALKSEEAGGEIPADCPLIVRPVVQKQSAASTQPTSKSTSDEGEKLMKFFRSQRLHPNLQRVIGENWWIETTQPADAINGWGDRVRVPRGAVAFVNTLSVTPDASRVVVRGGDIARKVVGYDDAPREFSEHSELAFALHDIAFMKVLVGGDMHTPHQKRYLSGHVEEL